MVGPYVGEKVGTVGTLVGDGVAGAVLGAGISSSSKSPSLLAGENVTPAFNKQNNNVLISFQKGVQCYL